MRQLRSTIQANRASLIVLIAALSGCGEAAVENTDSTSGGSSALEEPQPPAGELNRPISAVTAKAKTETPEPPPARDLREESAVASEFDVVAALNGGSSELFRGVPVIAEVALFVRSSTATGQNEEPRTTLSAKAGDWSSVVRWEVKNAAGERQDWKLHLAPPPEPILTATRTSPIQFKAWLSPEETRQLAAGAYRVVAVIDAQSSPLQSDPVEVQVQDEPRDVSPAQRSRRQEVWAAYWWLRGDHQQALEQIEERLKDAPGDVSMFALKADLLAQTGDIESALEACRQGIDAHLRKHGIKGPPPAALLIKQRELLNAAIAQDNPDPAAAPMPASSPAAAAAKALSEKDLITLLRLDIGDDAIIAKIGKDGVNMSVDEVLRKRLRDAGASDKVLAVIENSAGESAREKSLTFEEILSLLRLDISSDAILDRVKKTTMKPTLKSEQRDELRKSGASEKLLNYLSDEGSNDNE